MKPAQKLKEFYNKQFYEGTTPKVAHVVLSIEADGQQVTIPGIKLHPSATIDSIFKAYHQYLLQQEASPTPSPEPDSKILNVEQIEYKGHTYLVEQTGEEEFTVRNKESGKVLSDKSPIFKAVVKQFNPAL